jgi:hypothetical protein
MLTGRTGGESVLVDVELVNYGQVHPGLPVVLHLNQLKLCRESADGYGYRRFFSVRVSRVEVVVRVSRWKVDVASADPEFEDMIVRHVETAGPCHAATVAADLGTTGSLESGPKRIRYSVTLEDIRGTALAPPAGAQPGAASSFASVSRGTSLGGLPLAATENDAVVRPGSVTISVQGERVFLAP